MPIRTKKYSTEFHWSIENFHLISFENGAVHRSPSFYTKWRGQSWKLVLYPNGTEGSYTDIALYLMKVHPFLDNKRYHINLSIGHYGEHPHAEILHRNRRNFSVGNEDFLPIDPRCNLFERTVVVSCYQEEVHSHTDDLSEEFLIYQKLSNDLKNLYESRRYSDLKFLVDLHEIHAHKCILSVRCLGFHRQFGYRNMRDMPECSVPPVQVFRTKCVRPLLFIVQLLVSEVSEDERWFGLKIKIIDYSRSELLDDSSISVAWKLTLGSNNDPLIFKEEEYGNCDNNKGITNNYTSFSTNFTSYNSDFKTLGRNLKYLYNTRELLSDVRFLTQDKLSCKCHKALLWARWQGIRDRITLSEMNRDPIEINIGLSLETLLKYLSYLYYGGQLDLSPKDISELISLNQMIELPANLSEV
ncbi:hypothetical protein CEXT_512531 [Caerostris extrusa]|uniref:MATH domain-containing protein n=1 Tax=Caerostris extrusa TaxID=172846 RepID=A0AAV4N5T7_CAEEX|nr:hypothetical protein CEXT_512531 [Caerostris extrusa]